MTDKKRVQEIIKIHESLKNTRTLYETGWKEITKFCSPEHNYWDMVKDTTPSVAHQVYDGTPQAALNILANGMSGYMASKNTRSFKIGLESLYAVNRRPFEGKVRRYMMEIEEVFYWMINRSNFYESVNSMFKLGGSIATAVMFPEVVPGEHKIINVVQHPKHVWIAENQYGKVDTLFRTLMMSGKDIQNRWEDKLSDDLKKRIEEAPQKELEVLHAVLPRETRDITKIDNLNKRYASYWVLPDKDPKLLNESGFDDFPYVVWRWSQPAGHTYGWGPSHSALADVYRANAINKSLLEAAHQALYPALNVPSEMMGNVTLTPKGMNPYDDPSRIITPIQNVGSYPIGKEREEAVEKAIRDHYMVDMFLMLNANREGKRTAYEVSEMQAEKAAIMGPITTRTEGEFFDPLFDIYFQLAQKQGWLPSPPPELIDMLQGQEIKIDYIGPMSQVQKRFYSRQAIDMPLQRLYNYAQIQPEVLDVLNGAEVGRYLVNDSELPQNLIRSSREVSQIQQQRAMQQQQMVQAQTAKDNAKALKDMGDADQEGLEQMMGQTGDAEA